MLANTTNCGRELANTTNYERELSAAVGDGLLLRSLPRCFNEGQRCHCSLSFSTLNLTLTHDKKKQHHMRDTRA